MKYLKVIDGTKSNGFEYKLNEVNIAQIWNPNTYEPDKMGGFNFSAEDKILRWLHRGNTIYEVNLPKDAEIIEIPSKNCPHGIFRSNKILIKNPKEITENMVIELYKKSSLPNKTYYQCLVTLLYRNHIKAVKYIISDKINKDNIDECILEFEKMITNKQSKNNHKFSYDDLWNEAKEIYDILKEIQSDLLISICVSKEPYIKNITNDKIINITGESGSGKSTYTKKYLNNDNYIVIDTDEIFKDNSDNKNCLKFGKYLKDKYKDNFPKKQFDILYKEILDYFKDTNKTLVIDSAQYRNISDFSILKGKIIVIRTDINTCFKRCLNRYKLNQNYTEEELDRYANKKYGMYSWYKYLNEFIIKVDKL